MDIFQFFMLMKKQLGLKLELELKLIKNILVKILEEYGFQNVVMFQKQINI